MRVRRPSPGAAIAILALFIVLGGSAIAAVKAGSSTPLKVCVPAKEGKPIVTPKAGVCKTGYTLSEVNKEGSEGPAGSVVVDRIRLATPISTVTSEQSVTVPLANASWPQAADEDQQLIGKVVATTPSWEECTFTGYRTAPLTLEIDGKVASQFAFEPETATSAAHIPWQSGQDEGYVEKGGDWANVERARWLEAPSATTTHTLTLKASDQCTKGGHFTIDSVSIDVIGVR
jgi:hypothetical protein